VLEFRVPFWALSAIWTLPREAGADQAKWGSKRRRPQFRLSFLIPFCALSSGFLRVARDTDEAANVENRFST
jgi:hypothetical protein